MERRKGELFWKTLNLVVNCTFLLLAITVMTILLKNDNYRSDFSDYKIALEELRQEVNKVNQSNFMYLEDKINRVAGNQDSYQVNTTRRIEVLEARQQGLESRKRDNNRIINTNTNTLSK
jgi:hypothetical protein